ncbi:MAG: Glu-tRNA(Gln) amidotransferase subunit GatE [Candidatus Lokiarchaeota archaeon]|nr:Glu-tRNA(Gln) amidotransferase subunit GatE [Candidatus Lokiarchaeota archaeon]MBD3339400.1 Glu-tRNA(Gln) amidotransferase subunit GatE [Candidatus Lokiarchaeota archaeon]
MQKFNYQKLGLKCGLEIHQQLDSETKLFCRCPNQLQGTRDPDFNVKRYMRPVLGEMGTYDEAMLTEYEKGMEIIYECYNDVICTYELDETPPFDCNDEARMIALEIALLLNATIVDEMHVCRKNYLDGSVPCGFQRTMVLATGGFVELEEGKKVGIDLICLEEDAARRIKTENKTNYFRLDRLGIPLVEVTTKPDIRTPDECRECAERLGLLLWSTNVKKVLGSIRQDVNVSIKEGTRIEIKGVQKLDWIPILINNEISRQIGLVEIKKELNKRKISENLISDKPVDLTKKLQNTKCSLIAKGIKAGKKLHGINFEGFNGIFGKELMPDYRFGTEVASKVKSISGLKGLIHSDEDLKKYNFSNKDIATIKKSLKNKEKDCFVLVLGSKENAEKAMGVIIKRVILAFKGVPPETRRALEEGTTEFLRELHGGARLYPDTDSQAIINLPQEIDEISTRLPDYPWETIKKYAKKYDTEERIIKDLIFEGKLNLFDDLIEIYPDNPTLILTSLLETTTALRRDGKNIENLTDKDYKDIFQLLREKEIGKEAIEEFMIAKADSPQFSVKEIKEELNIESISKEDLVDLINQIVEDNMDIVKEREMRAMGPLMGEVMEKVRGKIDGKIVSTELKKAIQEKLK